MILALVFHLPVAAYAVLGASPRPPGLKQVFAVCLGCAIFARLMRIGLIPEDVCQECSDIRNAPSPPLAKRNGEFRRPGSSTGTVKTELTGLARDESTFLFCTFWLFRRPVATSAA